MAFSGTADMDIRAIKTNEAVFSAFLRLIETVSFSEITVKAICKEARISRSTFYDHFEDKFNMLRELMQYLSDETAKDFVYFTETSPAAGSMLALSDQYTRLYREMFYNPENAVMRDIYQTVISTDIAAKVRQNQGMEEDTPWLRVIGDFYANGILSIIKLWCGGKISLDAAQMSACVRILLANLHQSGSEMRSWFS